MNADLAKFVVYCTDNLAVLKTAKEWTWERIEYGGRTWKVGIGTNEEGKLEIRIRERL